MGLPNKNWKNKRGTGERTCRCGSWEQHWINYSHKHWPSECSVLGCSNEPTVGAHVINADVEGERIVPMCKVCNNRTDYFALKGNVACVPANRSETCDKT